MRTRLVMLTVAALAVVATACDPVVPVEEPDTWSFEGFTVHSHIPDDPVGMVYLFHGSGGSAAFASKIETVDQTNLLVERGYGWVATESSDRTGDRRWVVAENDTVVLDADIVADHEQQQAAGVATILRTKVEEPLLAARFTRIPAIDATEAAAIRAALEGTGVWDATGTRVLPLDQALPLILALSVPPSFGATNAEVADQIQALLAMHQFVGLFRTGVADFFDAQLA